MFASSLFEESKSQREEGMNIMNTIKNSFPDPSCQFDSSMSLKVENPTVGPLVGWRC